MNWFIVFIGGASLTVVLWLMLSNTGGFDGILAGNATGSEERPYVPNQLLPIQYDSELGQRLQSKHEKILKKLGSSLEGARRICQKIRKYDSAVIELNFAKIALDQMERYGGRMDNVRFQEHRHVINEALERAKHFIRHHEQNRYCPAVQECLKHLENRLNRMAT